MEKYRIEITKGNGSNWYQPQIKKAWYSGWVNINKDPESNLKPYLASQGNGVSHKFERTAEEIIEEYKLKLIKENSKPIYRYI